MDAIESYTDRLAKALEHGTSQLRALHQQAVANREFRDGLSAAIKISTGQVRSAAEAIVDIRLELRDSRASAETRAKRETASRILDRLTDVKLHGIPQEIDTLASEMISAPSVARAKALETELRLRVQKHNDDVKRRANDAEEAKRGLLDLDDLGADETSTLRESLERVALGRQDFTADLRSLLTKELEGRRSAVRAEQGRRAAEIVKKALSDLGYSAEPIAETLFVTGGTVHFQKNEWGEYYARLRVRPQGEEVNFNVVREDANDSVDDEAQRKRDAAAEAEWCREFGRLRETLSKRGLEFSMTRELGVGAVPVPRISAAEVQSVPKHVVRRKAKVQDARSLKREPR